MAGLVALIMNLCICKDSMLLYYLKYDQLPTQKCSMCKFIPITQITSKSKTSGWDFVHWGFCPVGILSVGILSAGILSVGILSFGILSSHRWCIIYFKTTIS